MNEAERIAAARHILREHIEAVVGRGAIPRFDEALTHPSLANESGGVDNQRLEFLGDAVLGLCVTEMLAEAHHDADEGRLTRMRSALVNAEALAAWARQVGLGSSVGFGRGAKLGTEREQTNVLADAAEALVAAVYDAHGLTGAKALVGAIVGERIDRDETLGGLDPKSSLQERVQSKGLPAPTYRAVEVRGVPHAQVFEVEVMVEGQPLARGEGRNKRAAERAAAMAALDAMDVEGAPVNDAEGSPSDRPPPA